MASHCHNPEKKAWRGRSYKKGGERVRELREALPEPETDEALPEPVEPLPLPATQGELNDQAEQWLAEYLRERRVRAMRERFGVK